MKVLNIPFNLVLLCALTPLLGAILKINLFNLPFLILVSITLIILVGNNFKFKIEYDFLFITFLITMISLILNVLLFRGFVILAMGGYVIIASFIFQNIYFLHKKIRIKKILGFFNFFYKFFLIIIIIEFCLVVSGYQPILDSFLLGYKSYNSNDTLKFFSSKFNQIGGLNSIFLGSQIAATISLLSFMWFSFTKKLNYFYNSKEFAFWKYLSLLSFIFTLTATNFLLLLIFISLLAFKIPKNLIHQFFFIFVLIILFFLIFYFIKNQIIFSRIFNSRDVNIQGSGLEMHLRTNTLHIVENLTTFQYYLYTFFNPLKLWYEQNLFTILFGAGNSINSREVFVGGDFAYGSIILFGGFLFTFFFTVLIIKILYNYIYLKFSNQFDEKIFQYFSFVIILLFCSLVHYGQAVTNSGIILFFAFHISIANLIIKNKIKFEKA